MDPLRSKLPAVATLALALAIPRIASAWEVRIVVRAEGRLDASYRLISPCPPDVYFCGTEQNEPLSESLDQVDTGQLLNPPAPVTRTASAPAVPAVGPYAGGAMVVASPGSLRAEVGAQAGGTFYQLSWLNEFDETESLDFFRQASAAGSANASLLDPITIVGPPGMVGTFDLVMTFDRALGVIGQGGGAASAQSFVFDPAGVGGTLAIVSISDCTTCNEPRQTATATFQAAAGSTWTLGQQLNGVTASATTSPSHPTSMVTVDVGNTMHTYLEIETPGFSIASDSGHDYVSVPEPDSFGCAVSAWLGIASVRRRGRTLRAGRRRPVA